MNGPETIDHLFAYVIENTNGLETVPSVLVPSSDQLPYAVLIVLIAADLVKAATHRRYLFAELLEQNPSLAGRTAKLVEFRRHRVVDQFTLPATRRSDT